MATTSCVHESEVLDLVVIEQWPTRATSELRAHVEGCAVCADIPLVARAMADLRDEATHAVVVPDASVVWLRAEMRARQDAARVAARPVWAAQLAATVVVAGLAWAWLSASHLLAAMATASSWVRAISDAVTPAADNPLVANAGTAARWGGLTILTLAVLVTLAISVSSLADRTSDVPDKGHRQ